MDYKIKNFISERLNKDYFLPSIQREFVWDQDKIVRLFDSIFQEYPIGQILVWHVNKPPIKDEFRWKLYKFIDDFDKENPHNDDAHLRGLRAFNLVLDGQQRLTALLIGLGGSFAYESYGKKRTEKLYINLFSSIEENPENVDDFKYDLKFFQTAADFNEKDGECWIELGSILKFETAEDFKDNHEELIEKKAHGDKNLIKKAKNILGLIYNNICSNDVIKEMTVNFRQEDDEKILNIFVRANDAGVPLEKADLLLSYMEAHEKYFKPKGARKEISDFVDELNKERLNRPNYGIKKDDVLKMCLVLSDSDVKYKIKNFNEKTLNKIDSTWPDIKKYYALTLDLLASYKFDPKNIISKNALIPIAYYLLINKKNSSFVNSYKEIDRQKRDKIIKWFIASIIHGAFGSSSDTTLEKVRGKIKDTKDLENPIDSFKKITRENIENWVSTEKYGSKYARLLLMLIIEDKDWGKYQVDHIFPESKMSNKDYLESKKKQFGFTQKTINFILSNYEYLPNLQILPSEVNNSKNDDNFSEWLQELDEKHRSSLFIPEGINYEISNFEEFFQKRKEKLIARLCRVLDVKEDVSKN